VPFPRLGRGNRQRKHHARYRTPRRAVKQNDAIGPAGFLPPLPRPSSRCGVPTFRSFIDLAPRRRGFSFKVRAARNHSPRAELPSCGRQGGLPQKPLPAAEDLGRFFREEKARASAPPADGRGFSLRPLMTVEAWLELVLRRAKRSVKNDEATNRGSLFTCCAQRCLPPGRRQLRCRPRHASPRRGHPQ
jgi:hypothetical protein